jgi:hypothetical protein
MSATCREQLARMADQRVWHGGDPELTARVRLLVWHMWCRGYGRVRVACTARSAEEQRQLYGQGRSTQDMLKAGLAPDLAQPRAQRVTWIHPDRSKHVQGRAADLDLADYDSSIGEAIAKGCGLLGLQWGGHWKVRDMCHVELRG